MGILERAALTAELALTEAKAFALLESQHKEPLLYGITNGEAVGTYLKHKFRAHLHERYDFTLGNSAEGVDLPGLGIDIKTTSVRQPQFSCPFKSAGQKIYGLGYSLLIFVYEKRDDPVASTANLLVRHVIYVEREQTGDFQTTSGLRRILEPEQGCLTISNALQWRLQYSRAIDKAGTVEGVTRLL